MLNRIYSLIFRNHAVDAILANFNSVISRLDQSVVHHTDIANAKTKLITEAEQARTLAVQEAARAHAISAKIKELLS